MEDRDDAEDDTLPDPEDVIAPSTDDEEPLGEDLPTPEEILVIHDEVEADYDLTHTGASVAAPRLKFERLLRYDVDPHDGVYMRAAALLRNIITAHYFEDGNKRTAWLSTRRFLDDHGEVPADRDPERVERVLKAIRAYDIDGIAVWLEDGEIDESRFHP